MRRGRLLLAIGLVAVAVPGGLFVAVDSGLLFHDTARPESVGDALRRFRAARLHPAEIEGVYLYRTRGAESIDALGGARHTYPATTTVTATAVACGIRLRWQPLQGRSMTWTMCATADGIVLRSSTQVHTFFGRRDSTAYTCANSLVRPVRVTAGWSHSLSCRSGGGRETGSARVVGAETIDVAGRRIAAVHVRTLARVSGGDRGTEQVDWWLDRSNGLPIRIGLANRTSRTVLFRPVHYREDADLRLVSAAPRR